MVVREEFGISVPNILTVKGPRFQPSTTLCQVFPSSSNDRAVVWGMHEAVVCNLEVIPGRVKIVGSIECSRKTVAEEIICAKLKHIHHCF